MAVKRYSVRVTAEWTVEVEAEDQYDAEYFAEGLVEGDHYWSIRPEYIDCWAQEVEDDTL